MSEHVTARVGNDGTGWIVVFAFHGFGPRYADPKVIGPFDSRADALAERDRLIDEVITRAGARGLLVEAVNVGDARVIRPREWLT